MTTSVLFDLDGTLVDSEAIAVEAFRAAFADCAGPGTAPAGQLLAMAGLPFEQIVETLGLPTTMVASFRRHSAARAHRVTLFPGIAELMSMLADRGAGMGIITGKDRQRAEQVIDIVGLGRFCTEMVTPSDPPAPKPSPDGVHWLLDRLAGTTGDAVLVGDSINDIRAGRAAGVYTVACTWGAGHGIALQEAGPDALVHSVPQLRDVLADRLAAQPAGPAT